MERKKIKRRFLPHTAVGAIRLLIDETIYRHSHFLTQQKIARVAGLSDRRSVSRILSHPSPCPERLLVIVSGIFILLSKDPRHREEAFLFLHCCSEWAAQAMSNHSCEIDGCLLSRAVHQEWRRICVKFAANMS